MASFLVVTCMSLRCTELRGCSCSSCCTNDAARKKLATMQETMWINVWKEELFVQLLYFIAYKSASEKKQQYAAK